MRKALAVVASVGALIAQQVLAQQGPAVDPIRAASFATSLQINLDSARRLDSGVYVLDLATGAGAEVSGGQSVTMQFSAWLSNGLRAQSTTPPQTFSLGDGVLLPGVEEGIVGMKVGGRRRLIVPPVLAYGDRAAGPVPANSILIVDVTVVAVSGGSR
jgi:FKBP-type peptidyl-prolyl cis-trans isomerase